MFIAVFSIYYLILIGHYDAKFCGEVRFYTRFKRDFNELVLPNLDEREAVFTLRQCLAKNVESEIGSGDFDLKKMFERLMFSKLGNFVLKTPSFV